MRTATGGNPCNHNVDRRRKMSMPGSARRRLQCGRAIGRRRACSRRRPAIPAGTRFPAARGQNRQPVPLPLIDTHCSPRPHRRADIFARRADPRAREDACSQHANLGPKTASIAPLGLRRQDQDAVRAESVRARARERPGRRPGFASHRIFGRRLRHDDDRPPYEMFADRFAFHPAQRHRSAYWGPAHCDG